MKTLNKIFLILLLASCSKKDEPTPKIDTRVRVDIHYCYFSPAHQFELPKIESARVYNLQKGYKLNLDIVRSGKYIIFDGHDSFLVKSKFYDVDTLTIYAYANGKLIYKNIGDKQTINAEL